LNRKIISNWIDAARPKTLAAAFVPVLTGGTLAYVHNSFNIFTTLAALVCAFLIQVGTNFANDYFDFKKGADTDQRIGFQRASATGLIRPSQMLVATIISMSTAFILGLYLVWIGGWVILIIGILSLVFGVLYTGGPFPLGYNGLGDLFVFIFFGIVAVTGTYYVNALEWSFQSFLISIPVGALSVNILVVNNLRDIEQDRIANKKTLGVLFGENVLKAEYVIMLVISYVSVVFFWMKTGNIFSAILPVFAIPLAVPALSDVLFHNDKKILNKTLEKTARFMVLFGVLLSVGLVL